MSVLATLEAMEAELQQETYDWLVSLGATLRAEADHIPDVDDQTLDVRLQVYADGSHGFHSGDASYDQDHRGFWGAAVVAPYDDTVSMTWVAQDLVAQVLDACAQSEV